MAIDPDAFRPLLGPARIALAAQINAGEADAERLAAVGFGWTLAFQLARQMASGGNASVLVAHGLSGPLAKAIANACDASIAARTPVVEQPKPARTFRGAHMSGMGRGAVVRRFM